MLGRLPRRAFFAGERSLRHLRTSPTTCLPRKIPSKGTREDEEEASASALSFASKYKVYRDADSTIVGDTSYEFDASGGGAVVEPEDDFDEFEGLELKRGVSGVFEVDELVAVLRRENARNVLVCRVPPDSGFVAHICVVTARSAKHMLAIAEFVRKLFKRKRGPDDTIPHIEGRTSTDWMALDLGNVALHIFSEKARPVYDLEQLWSVGPEYDHEYKKADSDIIKLLEQHSLYLDDLKPANENDDDDNNDTKAKKKFY